MPFAKWNVLIEPEMMFLTVVGTEPKVAYHVDPRINGCSAPTCSIDDDCRSTTPNPGIAPLVGAEDSSGHNIELEGVVVDGKRIMTQSHFRLLLDIP
ncbi:hypothetical protein [Azospirillum palustre]|uniref:hypothetical protein n=1 Tax=Azospirillum palustre TaxID=2044885 RepID=UPI00117763C9|nr:hypothetical protein [Azospirillum palustre]